MSMYSMIQFMAVIMLYFAGTVLGDWQYLYQDLFVVFPLVVFMGYTKASHKLGVKRPSGNLLSASNVINILVHIALCLAFQVMIFIFSRHQRRWGVLSDMLVLSFCCQVAAADDDVVTV